MSISPNYVYSKICFYFEEKSINLTSSQIKDVTAIALAKLEGRSSDDIENKLDSRLKVILDEIIVSPKTPWNPHIGGLSSRQELIFQTLRGNVPFDEILKDANTLLPAIVWKKNPALLKEGRDLIQKIFDDIEETMKDSNISPSDSFHMEMIIGDLLSLYPFLRPDDKKTLRIPILDGEKWKMVEYTVKKVPLTPRWLGSQIMAYGLTANNASPLLLFKGTTYPTDKGFGLSLLTDINPLSSVGAYVYNIGKDIIKEWFEQNAAGPHKAIVYGKSLGGAHAWRTALNFPEYVEKTMAYGAPGLSSSDIEKLDAVNKLKNPPIINIFCQKNDPVPYFDSIAKEGINYYQVVSSKTRHLGVVAHADMFSTHENSIILKLDFNKRSQRIKRVALTTFRAVGSFICFPFTALLFAIYTASERAAHAIYKSIREKLAK